MQVRTHLLIILLNVIIPITHAGLTVPIYSTADSDKSIGTIEFEDSFCGVLITPHLKGLSPGLHGIHIHKNPSCEEAGKSAGDHLDTEKAHSHKGPYAIYGHTGDLPILIVNENGKATLPLLAPRLTVEKITGHSIIIHAGGDNYSDQPEKLGGGGDRIACGVIK